MLCQMGFFVLSVSTAHRHGFSFRTVQQYWATLRKPLRPASPRPDWGLIWFGFWLFFSVFIGWRSVVLFFRVITATSNPKTLKRGSKSSPNFVFLIQRTGCPPQNWRGKSASLISVYWTCAQNRSLWRVGRVRSGSPWVDMSTSSHSGWVGWGRIRTIPMSTQETAISVSKRIQVCASP